LVTKRSKIKDKKGSIQQPEALECRLTQRVKTNIRRIRLMQQPDALNFRLKKESASAGNNIVHVSEGILKAPSEKKIQR
jgi:hypothetical protein